MKLAAFTALLAISAAAHAQPAGNYPTRPVRMLIPFSPGGATDVPGRIVAQKLSERLGHQVVVDNRPGAGGVLATEVVATAQPDGYTILMTGTPFVISPAIYKKLPFHPLRDFVPVMQFGSAPNTLVVHPSLPAKSVQELMQLVRAQPGKIDWASSGTGGAQHLFGALFTSMAKIDMTHVPYKGSGPATTDLLGGQVKVGFPGIAIALPHHKTGRLRILAVTSAKRSPQAPEVPSLAESGVPGYDATLWLGIVAPRGTPAAVIAKLNSEITSVLQAPDLRQQFANTGTDPVATTPAEFGALLKIEVEKWARVVRDAGIIAN